MLTKDQKPVPFGLNAGRQGNETDKITTPPGLRHSIALRNSVDGNWCLSMILVNKITSYFFALWQHACITDDMCTSSLNSPFSIFMPRFCALLLASLFESNADKFVVWSARPKLTKIVPLPWPNANNSKFGRFMLKSDSCNSCPESGMPFYLLPIERDFE